MEKYIIAAGGTAGHINPALEVARALKKEGKEVIFIGSSNRLEEKLIPQEEFELISLDLSYKRDFLSFYKLIRAIFKVFKIIKDRKIDKVLAFGSYITVPTLISALMLRKDIYLHEQNLKMGLANRIFRHFARKVFLSFPFHKMEKNYLLVGLPVREAFYQLEREQERKKLNISGSDKVLFIIGGSQGAKILNESILENIEEFLKVENLKIFWVTGNKEFIEKVPKHKNLKLFVYCDNVPSLMYSSDLMISRAGASILAEILVTKTPAILIPYTARKAGQLENAKFFESVANLPYFLESDIKRAINLALELLNNQLKLTNIRGCLEKFSTEKAIDKILKELL